MNIRDFSAVILTVVFITQKGGCDHEREVDLVLNIIAESFLELTAVDYRSESSPASENERLWPFDDAIFGFPTIDTTSGMVMGQTNKDSHAFYSIPYAQPPVGELR